MNQAPVNSRTVVFCLPGNSFSGRFLECWTNLLAWCLSNGIRPLVSRKYSNNIYYSRNLCLGGDVTRGASQKPFNGELVYDFLLWIDSDILFSPQQFERLLRHDKDIVSGVYAMEGGTHFATVPKWDEAFFEKHGHFEFLPVSAASGGTTGSPNGAGSQVVAPAGKRRKAGRKPPGPAPSLQSAVPSPSLLPVDYTGMGFMLVKRGVFEGLDYPWFKPLEKRIGNMVDFTMEDVAFCLQARERGWNVWVDLGVRVGHEKAMTL